MIHKVKSGILEMLACLLLRWWQSIVLLLVNLPDDGLPGYLADRPAICLAVCLRNQSQEEHYMLENAVWQFRPEALIWAKASIPR